MWIPLSWVMEAATIMAIALAHGGVSPYDFSFFFFSFFFSFLSIFQSKVSNMNIKPSDLK